MHCGSGGDGRREEGGEALKGIRNGKVKVRFEGKNGWAAYGGGGRRREGGDLGERKLNMLKARFLRKLLVKNGSLHHTSSLWWGGGGCGSMWDGSVSSRQSH